MEAILRKLVRAFGRIFPDCLTLSQAIAFNMFLAFFPLLLLVLGLFSTTSLFQDALQEIPYRLNLILPPGSGQVVAGYFIRRAVHPWRWFLLGLGGTLLAGMQVMVGYMEGFRVIEGDLLPMNYWRRQARALGLLSLTIIPMLAFVVFTVFGRQSRAAVLSHSTFPIATRDFIAGGYAVAVLILAMGVLVLLYRIGRPGHAGFRVLLPGALVSTVLWWAADVSFGWYVRKMPYDVVYRGLASAIGLLLWMFLTAIIVLLGAAYNAEAREAREAAARASNLTVVVP
jgi:membrane protein